MNPSDGPDRRDEEDLERASENVLGGWPSAQLEDPPADPVPTAPVDGDEPSVDEPSVDEPGPVAPPDLAPDDRDELFALQRWQILVVRADGGA